jgi:hypothetical protein
MSFEFLRREQDDGITEGEQRDRADDQSHESRARIALVIVHNVVVGRVIVCHVDSGLEVQVLAASVTRTEFITSFCVIFFMCSSPFTTLPKTVCTPLRCLVFVSLSTMKN